MAEELEFKLAIDPGAAADLWPALRSRHPGLRTSRQTLFSAYYDSPGEHLRQSGVALRLRRDGKRWIQAIKRAGEVAGGLHSRSEHEVEVAAQLPSFPAMADAGIGELAAKVRDDLQVVFTTEFERTSALLRPTAETAIEVVLDRGTIAAADRRDPICEIELELKTGSAQDLLELARWLAQSLPVRLDDRSKAQRGYNLRANQRAMPVKAGASRVRADMTVGAGLRRLAFQCLAQLQANEAGVLAGRNREYVHQARVALRRLRSLFRLFDSTPLEAAVAPLAERLRSLADVLGELRNLDVLIHETLPATDCESHPGVTGLRQQAVRARRTAGQAARAAMSASSYTLLMLDLLELLDGVEAALPQPLPAFASDVLDRQLRKARRRARGLDALGYADLHRLRIALKRLRYAMEFFQPLWPKSMTEALEALEGLQDLLGQLNDGATAWKLLDGLAVQQADPDFQQAVGYVRGWTARDAEQCRRELGKAWDRFARVKPGWR